MSLILSSRLAEEKVHHQTLSIVLVVAAAANECFFTVRAMAAALERILTVGAVAVAANGRFLTVRAVAVVSTVDLFLFFVNCYGIVSISFAVCVAHILASDC